MMKHPTNKGLTSDTEKNRPAVLEGSIDMDSLESGSGVLTRSQYRRLSLSQGGANSKKKSPIKTSRKTPSKSDKSRPSPIVNEEIDVDLSKIPSECSPSKKRKATGSRLSLKKKNVNANNGTLISDSSPSKVEILPLHSELSTAEDLKIEAIFESNREVMNASDKKKRSKQKSRHSKEFPETYDNGLEVLEEDDKIVYIGDEIKEMDLTEEMLVDNTDMNISSSKKKKSSKKRKSAEFIEPVVLDVSLIKEEDELLTELQTITPSNTGEMLIEEIKEEEIKEEEIKEEEIEEDEDILIINHKKGTPEKLTRESITGKTCNSENRPQTVKKSASPKKALQDVVSVESKQSRNSVPGLLVKKPTKLTDMESKSASKKTVIEDDSDSDDDSDAECRKEIMRSAEKRIIRNISTSESESRNVKTFLFANDITGNDSDSAPEDVTFDASRKSALDLLKHTVDSIKRDKLKKKEQRKERLEILRLRKEENLIRLKERRANQEDASCSSSEESVHEKHMQLNKYNELLSKGKKTYFDEETKGKTVKSTKQIDSKVPPKAEKPSVGLKRLPSDLLENLPDHPPKKMKLSYQTTIAKPMQSVERMEKVKDYGPGPKHRRDIDFIPIESSGSTQFGVVSLDKPKLKTVAQQAADFRHNMLYGNRNNRVPGNTHIINQQKLKFVNNKK